MNAAQKTIRVVLADDHPIVLDGLEQLFRLEPDFEVVARCRDGEKTLETVRELAPGLLVLDVRMPGLDGLGVLASLREQQLETRVLLLTAAIENAQIVEALRLGARGLVLKEMAPDLLVEAARKIAGGGQWFDPALLARAAETMAQGGARAGAAESVMTPREREIVAMVGKGLRNRAIAEKLGISEGTVKLHLHHVYEKLSLTGRLELLLYAQKHPVD